MKSVKIIYWTSTIVFAVFMAFTAIPSLMGVKEAMDAMAQLGYPVYFVKFISVAKILGAIALLVPGFPKIREWAYAGLFFDLMGAAFSIYSIGGLKPDILFVVIPALVGIVSYVYNQKNSKA
ncbi:MAG: DoxX family protein [Chitinophagaceae bacterium]|jgi:putative effector of murein hydrolase LrgA (UPF0299 family)|nr:DoxX family protein [Chitinophagaceae bacterium]